MGYTTNFKGTFAISPALSAEQILALRSIDEHTAEYAEGEPDGYCQWIATEDGMGLKWDGGEKFYDYIEWLEWLMKALFIPKGFSLTGEVWWQGEDIGDVGVITANGDSISVRKPQF